MIDTKELSGAELDAAVARCMGWPYVKVADGCRLGIKPGGNQMLDMYEVVPGFSSNWSAFGELVEWLQQANFRYRAEYSQRSSTSPREHSIFIFGPCGRDEDGWKEAGGASADLRIALCRAVVAAFGVV